ncbi:hypothetical protein [Flavobacterium sp. XGLA_31]|uniref:hypothetical protein n=1 Tax=Flavobacterium sp. XGLA_31 TaxID=3447666 RepID=UPI003F318915
MKIIFSTLFLLTLCLTSCQEDPKQRALEQERDAQKREVIFNSINKDWNFNAQPINATSRGLTNEWNEWRMFLNELGQKPKSTIGAFQQKAKALTKRVADLNNNIPPTYDLPEIKSRVEAISTKINSINLYIHLNQIPDKKIIQLVKEINIELASFQQKLDEVVIKKQIKTEEGESDMLRMLDTTRAIPTHPGPNVNIIK